MFWFRLSCANEEHAERAQAAVAQPELVALVVLPKRQPPKPAVS